MKLLVFAHRLELGGTQVNAIELAAHLRDKHGFDIIFHASEGPALDLLKGKGLRFAKAPDVRLHPSWARMRALRDLVRKEQPELIHAWDWWQGLEAYCAAHLTMRTPLVITDMMMNLTRSMPREVPTTFGFANLKAEADRKGWRKTCVLVPPVDIQANAPGCADGRAFRRGHGAKDTDIVLVSVSRLSEFMKADGLIRAIAVVRDLGRQLPLKLLIVGDGAARPKLQRLAEDTNRHLQRDAVVLTGAKTDPRPAYDAADVVLGMGGSALRGMAFGKPVVVLGERGFAKLFTPQCSEGFRMTGMFGIGDGGDDNRNLATPVISLAKDAALRVQLGQFGRDFVMRHHGLEPVGDVLAEFCQEAVAEHPAFRSEAIDALRTAYFYLRERRFRVASRDALPVR